MWKKGLIVIFIAFAFKRFLEFYFGPSPWGPKTPAEPAQAPIQQPKTKMFTPDELKSMSTDTKLYLAILGSVYDVSKGSKHYAKGGSYDFFTGVDASRAYVTGEFKNDLNDKIDDLSGPQIADIFNWKTFYDTTYTFIGYLEGRFYDKNGEKTQYMLDMEKVLEEQKNVEKLNSQFQGRFPSCNSEWTQEKGLVRVWCSTESGGIKREWTGVPRLVYNPNSKVESCACVNENDLSHPSVKPYPNCDPKATQCNPSNK